MNHCLPGLTSQSLPASSTQTSHEHSCSRPTTSSIPDMPRTTSLSGPTTLISLIVSELTCASISTLTLTESMLGTMPSIWTPATLNQLVMSTLCSTTQASVWRQTSRLKCMESGPLHLWLPKQLYSMLTLTTHKNFQNMRNMSWVNLQHLSTPRNTSESSTSTMQSICVLPAPMTYHLTDSTDLVTSSCTTSSSASMWQQLKLHDLLPKNHTLTHTIQTLKSVANGMPADALPTPASIVTSASSAAINTKRKAVVELRQVREQSELGMSSWKHPKWSRGFLWVCDASLKTPSATFTEIAAPLPDVPPSESCNHIPNSTITSHPHLFKIVMPIKVDCFEQCLSSHPNWPLIDSVCWGLCEGFWPFAIFNELAPQTWDNSSWPLKGPNLEFALKQWDKEIIQDCFSPSFGPDLLPGMYSMPIRVVPKPQSTDLCLVTDHSVGEYTLNSFIAPIPWSSWITCKDLAWPSMQSLLNMEIPQPGFSSLMYWQLIDASLCTHSGKSSRSTCLKVYAM